MSKVFDVAYKLGNGVKPGNPDETSVLGYNISLYYSDPARIQLVVSGRETTDGKIVEIDEGNKVLINSINGFSIVYDHKEETFTLSEVEGDGKNFGNDDFRKNYQVNSLNTGTGDAFDAKISLDSRLEDSGAEDEIAIIGANDGRDYSKKNASMLVTSLDSTPVYVFYAGSKLFVHVHNSRAKYLSNPSFKRTGVPRWGRDFSVIH